MDEEGTRARGAAAWVGAVVTCVCGAGCRPETRRPTGRTPENRWEFLKTLDADTTLQAAHPGDTRIYVCTTQTGYRWVSFWWLHAGNRPNVSQRGGGGRVLTRDAARPGRSHRWPLCAVTSPSLS